MNTECNNVSMKTKPINDDHHHFYVLYVGKCWRHFS